MNATDTMADKFNAFAEGVEQLWDKAVVKTLDVSGRFIGTAVDMGVEFSKAAAVALPIGAALGLATYQGGGFHVESVAQSLQGGALVFGGFGTMIGGIGLSVGTADDENSVGRRVEGKIAAYRDNYAARNNVQLGAF